MEESTGWVCVVFAAAMVTITGIVSCSRDAERNDALVEKAMELGQDPVLVRCALDSPSDDRTTTCTRILEEVYGR